MSIKIIYLSENDPDPPEGEKWILIEEDSSGSWYGTGFSMSHSGREIVYISLPESDVNYGEAMSAASKWAENYPVDAIYVRELP